MRRFFILLVIIFALFSFLGTYTSSKGIESESSGREPATALE
jgi:hypothetical protein